MTHRTYTWLKTDNTAARAAWASIVPNVMLQENPPETETHYRVGTHYLTAEQDAALVGSGYFTVT